ncbi:MAG TPA: secretin and TonB N-terminal domain-containing protein [Candidatus Omnitrophota bacterium]|nr:secretin and TonB N-terminal domain-containing protein [Candidatus Omnitrophota bacterium]
MKGNRIRILLFFLIIFGFLFSSPLTNLESQEKEQPAQGGIIETSAAVPAAEELINLDFENTDIKDVIRVLSQKSGVNIILGQDVAATVTIQLKDTTWEKALDVILKNYNLTYKKEENLIRIMTLEQLKNEEEKIPLVTEIITLDFASVGEIKNSLDSMLSVRGKIQVSPRTNALIVTDTPDKVKLIKQVAQDLDLRTPQVMIEALMVDVTLGDQYKAGVELVGKPATVETEASFGQDLSLTRLTADVAGSIVFNKTLFETLDLASLIELWKENKKVNILANPRVMTLDNLTATIKLTEQIPYTSVQQTEQGSYSSTQFKEAGIELFVTPHITTKDNYISMNIKVEQSFQSGTTSDNQPIIDSRNAETNLMVKDKQTIVIGGLRRKTDSTTIDKVPILGDLPFIGAAFRRTVKVVTNVDLLIFVTPTIVTQPRFSKKEKERFEEFSEKRELEDVLTVEGEVKEPFSLRPPE